MHQEITKREKISPIKMLFFILIGTVVLILFNFVGNLLRINASLTDGLTLIIATVLAYIIIKKYITSYKYMLIEDEFIIQEITGSKEKTIIYINTNQIKKIKSINSNDYDKDKKQKFFKRKKLNKHLKNIDIYYCIYEENDKLNLLEIQPSSELIKLLNDIK
ncbi:hypothetical protein SH1V18_28080 [Vallitalea longa]|uniref:Uncharacterized protein n=1 Tax=Vallitalea longa TaxID=2936439 RepID=A0A9W5YFN2_9FIRM|nr:hypothetical protein [Vallitalea longa]GKX30328.1 hypothetical protein SH1V18_28080 [Vallitalea longa]